ncbi:transposable element Tcb1 transposase [Trichonephila clavipes]|nr:transposable element Tcb1 transposase [Trichonephila clavipes]
MTGGRTKCTALVNQVLFPYSMEPVQEDLKNDVPFSVVTDASNKDHEVEKFTKNATNAYHRALAYIEKWYPFENQNYKTFSCLNLECGRLTRWINCSNYGQYLHGSSKLPLNRFTMNWLHFSVFPSLKLEGNSIEMWCKFFQKEEAPNLLKIVQFVCSVPVSIAFVERIFSAMGNLDNDPKHTARNVKMWCLFHCKQQLHTPSQSPDINVIENLWVTLETAVQKHQIRNKAHLKQVLQEEWDTISPDTTKKLVESVPRRLEGIIKVKGHATKY